MLTQNFRASAQSALISAIMAVSTFALVIGPDAVRYGALAALLVLAPTAMLAFRMGSVTAPDIDPATLKTLEVSPAEKVDQVVIAAAWLGVAGAFVIGLAAIQRFDLAGGLPLQLAATAAAGLMALGATPIIAGLIRPLPVVEISATGLKLTPTRQIRWRDMDAARIVSLGRNRMVIKLKPSPRDPGGPAQHVRVLLPAVLEPWMRSAATTMIERNLAASEPARLSEPVHKPKSRRRQGAIKRIEDKRFQEMPGQGQARADIAGNQARLSA
jgi:hypothetical protein